MINQRKTNAERPTSARNVHLNITLRTPVVKKLIPWALVFLMVFTLLVNVHFLVDHMKTFSPQFEKQGHYVIPVNAVAKKQDLSTDVKYKRTINIEAYSGKNNVFISVNGTKVLEGWMYNTSASHTGIFITVLNQATGALMTNRVFDVYQSQRESVAMVRFLNMVTDGRIICLAVMDEASYKLKTSARNLLRSMGSVYINSLQFRDTWAFILAKKRRIYAEVHNHKEDKAAWGDPVVARATIELTSDVNTSKCNWGNSDEFRRRKALCDKYEGYGDVCHCSNPASIDIASTPLSENRLSDIPVAVIASNRPYYLYRGLRSMLSADGAKRELFTVFIDGFFEEPAAVAQLLGIKFVQHAPINTRTARISQHYKRTLTETFNMFPDAKYMIILEEDLDVSVDIFSYFSQLLPLMDEDESLYCVSAWNDQGYDHTSKDPSVLYRVEGMPGLGWLLKRSIYKEEIEPKWPSPDLQWDWDIWMRMESNRKGRECVIPDVSRTYHFGSKGLHVNSVFQDIHFSKRLLNTVPNVKFNIEQMKKDNYEVEVERLVSSAIVLNHTKNPCKNEKDFIPDTTGKTYIFYIEMKQSVDWTTWNNIARCLHIWDIDARGYHRSMWRMWLKRNHVLIVGSPASPYAKHKPNDVKPIFIPKKT